MAAAYVKIYVNKMDDYHLVRTYGGNERDVKHMAYNYANLTVEEFVKKHPFYTNECKDCFKLILVYVKKRSSKIIKIETPINMNQTKWLIGNHATTVSIGNFTTKHGFRSNCKMSINYLYRLSIFANTNGHIVSKHYTVKDTNPDTESKVINSFLREYGTCYEYIFTSKMNIIDINGNMTIRYKDYYIFDHGADKVVLISAIPRSIKVIDTFDSIEDALNWIDDSESYLNVLLKFNQGE